MFPFSFTLVDAASVRRGTGRWRRPALVAVLLPALALALVAGPSARGATPHLTAADGAGPFHLETPEALRQNRGETALGAVTDELPATPEDAAARISGSPWPGVINHLLQWPAPGAAADPGGLEIHMDYPSVGLPAVDADIRAWVSGIANAFAAHLDLSRQALADGDMNSPLAAEAPGEPKAGFELWGSYSISRPSDAALSITFEIWNYAGATQGNLDILTLNYSLLTGQRLAFMDLFERPETALSLMSEWSRKELAPRLGATMRMRTLEEGTAPLVENFSSLTLTPQGICINFQPYQVAPWAAGVQKVEMPLEALLPAGPLLALWGR